MARPFSHIWAIILTASAVCMASPPDATVKERAQVFLPKNPKLDEALKALEDAAAKENWAAVASAAARLIADFAGASVEAEEGLHRSAAEYGRQALLAHPEALKAYRAAYDADARAAVQRVRESLSPINAAEGVQRYSLSSPGKELLLLAGAISLDHGDLTGALYHFDRLLSVEVPGAGTALYDLTTEEKIACETRRYACLVKLGARRKAAELRDVVLRGLTGGTVKLGNQTLDAAALGRLLDRIEDASGVTGAAGATGAESEPVPLRARLWRAPLPGGIRGPISIVAKGGLEPLSLYLVTGQWTAALDGASGAIRWAHPDYPGGAPSLMFQDRAPKLDFLDHDAYSLLGDRLVCLDQETGKVRWDYVFEEKAVTAKKDKAKDKDARKPPEKEKVEGAVEKERRLLSGPTVAGSRVVVAETRLLPEKSSESILHFFEASTGRQLSSILLCERDAKGLLGAGVVPGHPLYFRGKVYAPTSIGALVCVEPLTGEVDWTFVYDSYPEHLRRRTIELDRRREGAQQVWPLVDRLFLAATDSPYLYCLEPGSGRVLWMTEGLGTQFVAGVTEEGPVMVGDTVRLLSAESGKVLWESAPVPKLVGQPLLSGSVLWLPSESGLMSVSLKSDRSMSSSVGAWAVRRCDTSNGERRLYLADSRAVEAYVLAEVGEPSAEPGPEERIASLRAALSRLPEGKEAERKRLADELESAEVKLVTEYVAAGEAGRAEELLKAMSIEGSAAARAWALLELGSLFENQSRASEAIGTYLKLLRHSAEVSVPWRHGIRVPAGVAAELLIDRLLQKDRSLFAEAESRASDLLEQRKIDELWQLYPNSEAAEQTAISLKGDKLLSVLLHGSLANPARVREVGEKQSPFVPPTELVWEAPTRLSVFRAQPLAGEWGGRLLTALRQRSMLGAGSDFDALECRDLETGLLLWAISLGNWTGQVYRIGESVLVRGRYGVDFVDLASGKKDTSLGFREGQLSEKLAAEPAEPDTLVGIACDARRVYLASEGGAVAALSTDGKILWQTRLPEEGVATDALVLAGNVLCVARRPGCTISGLDPETGKELWNRAIEGRLTTLLSSGDSLLVVLLDERKLVALAAEDGSKVWELSPAGRTVALLKAGRRIIAVPDAGSPAPSLLGIDGVTGAIAWSRSEDPGSIRYVLCDGGVYVLRRNFGRRHLAKLSPDDGTTLWKTLPLDYLELTGSPPADGKWVIALAGEQHGEVCTILIDKETGKIVEWLKIKGPAYGWAAVVGDKVVIATGKGTYAYGHRQPLRAAQMILDGTQPEVLANAALRLGDFDAAVRILETALRDPKLPDPRFAALEDMLAGVKEARVRVKRPVLIAKRLSRPPIIDGDLSDEWDEDSAVELNGLSFVDEIDYGVPRQRTWLGENDLSGKLYVGWDETNLYFALKIRDTVMRAFDDDSDEWVGDGLLISIDCDNDGGFGFSPGRDLLLTLAMMNKAQPQREEETPKGSYAVERTGDNTGTVYEVAIPWSYIRWITPAHGTAFGFNVTVTDDDGTGAKKALNWSPGLFFHRSKTLLPMGYTPEYFGEIILADPLQEK